MVLNKSVMMKKLMLGLIVFSAFLGACSKSSSSPSYTPDCSGPAKSFKTDAQPVIQGSCVGCHSNYSTYSGITADKSAIRASIVDGSMPKNSSLSATQKNNVVCWIDNGAPNN